MDINDLVELVSNVASGKDDLERAAVGFYGYGFVFKDPRNFSDPYVITVHSSKFTDAGAYRGITEKILERERLKSIDELELYDDKYDCLFAGAIKTLVPTLEFFTI